MSGASGSPPPSGDGENRSPSGDGRRVRLVLSGGGTAGHVYPALALLDAWAGARPEVHWIGSVGGMEQGIVGDRGIAFTAIRAAAIRDRSPLRTVVNVAVLLAGFAQALATLRRLRPQVVLTTGGYVTVPVAYAAAVLRIPVVVFLPDVRPGLAVRAQSRVATMIAVAFGEAARHLPADRTIETGYPLRPALLAARRDVARRRLRLGDELPVVLVYGGSRGARTLNDGVAARLEDVLHRCQLLHVCGTLDEPRLGERRAQLPDALAERYHLFGFIGDQLVDALAAADLAVTRAGAATLAELPAVGLPAILVPGPFSDQDQNATWLASSGGGLVVDNDAVRDGGLTDALLDLLDDPDRLAAMAAAIARVGHRDAAGRLQKVVERVAGGDGRRGGG